MIPALRRFCSQPLAELLILCGLALGTPLTAHVLSVLSHYANPAYQGLSWEDMERLIRMNERGDWPTDPFFAEPE